MWRSKVSIPTTRDSSLLDSLPAESLDLEKANVSIPTTRDSSLLEKELEAARAIAQKVSIPTTRDSSLLEAAYRDYVLEQARVSIPTTRDSSLLAQPVVGSRVLRSFAPLPLAPCCPYPTTSCRFCQMRRTPVAPKTGVASHFGPFAGRFGSPKPLPVVVCRPAGATHSRGLIPPHCVAFHTTRVSPLLLSTSAPLVTSVLDTHVAHR